MFTLEDSAPRSEAGGFSRIRISVPGEREFVVEDVDGFVSPFDKDSWISKKLLNESRGLIKSRNVLVLRETESVGSNTLVILIGYAYASSPGSLWVIRLGESGPPFVAFHKREMGLTDVIDLNGDGKREIVGYPCLHQAAGDKIATYDPSHVFELSETKAQLSLRLTQKYNSEKYVWAGLNCSESIGVQTIPGRKPKLVKIQ